VHARAHSRRADERRAGRRRAMCASATPSAVMQSSASTHCSATDATHAQTPADNAPWAATAVGAYGTRILRSYPRASDRIAKVLRQARVETPFATVWFSYSQCNEPRALWVSSTGTCRTGSDTRARARSVNCVSGGSSAPAVATQHARNMLTLNLDHKPVDYTAVQSTHSRVRAATPRTRCHCLDRHPRIDCDHENTIHSQ
jgi:hypothetical protein